MRRRCIAALLVSAAVQAGACGLHGAVPELTPAHPRSLDVALALRDAYQSGELQALATVPPVLQLLRSQKTLRALSPRLHELTPPAKQQPASLALLLVESGLWSRYSSRVHGVTLQTHVDGPRAGEPVLLSSEAVLQAILAERLSPARAAELGLLLQPVTSETGS